MAWTWILYTFYVASLFPGLDGYVRAQLLSTSLLELFIPGKYIPAGHGICEGVAEGLFPCANQEVVDVLMENISRRATIWALSSHGKQDPSWPPT